MLEEKRKRETIALTKNKSYKTYQFHGIVGKGKNPDAVFQSSIVQVFTWMQDRFRNIEEIPKPLLLPKEEKLIKDSIFKSFVVE
ncbi:MAG: hypothetical protein JJE17_05765, partial [Peptostreptococcaceae bacterium]|nr:hypothetical protein [Peptostreptococcaceae bacterium]